MSNLHKMTDKSFSATMTKLYEYVNPKNDWAQGLVLEIGRRRRA